MVRSEKKVVLAWTHAQALHFAQSMGWKRDEWESIGPGGEERLLGRYGVILYDLRAPRYRPDPAMEYKMARTRDVIIAAQSSGRIAHTNVVNLP